MHFTLIPHPSTPPSDPELKLWANVEHAASLASVATANIWFGVSAPAERFVIPAPAEPQRTDELWQTTCFEAFLRPLGKKAYREWNFAPSGAWAAYDFKALRKGGSAADVPDPYVRMEDNFTWWAVGASFAVPVDTVWELGLSAVLEVKDGTKSYWALAHCNPDKPDFHDPGCFVARLA